MSLNAAVTQADPRFIEIAKHPEFFPPVGTAYPRDAQISFDGLLIGSNANGLAVPQRTYTHISRSAVVETVVSSLARGIKNNFLVLPQLQDTLIKSAAQYTKALQHFGVPSPFLVLYTLAGVQGMRLLQDYPENKFLEDIPYGQLTQNIYTFSETEIASVPASENDWAKLLHPTLNHMANAAGRNEAPYFDADGNYMLKG